MPKNILEQIGDALTGADRREDDAARKAQADAEAAAEAQRRAMEQAQVEAEAARAKEEAAMKEAAEATAKAQAEAKAAAEAQYADMQRQINEGKQRAQEEELANLKAEVRQMWEQPAMNARTYTVKSGDSLWAIANEIYGDGSRWPEIFEANRDKISDANLIYPGQELKIP
jgi:nucleoid-associated protein YgaU